ncbi:MAG: lipoprotein, partial [Hydrogenophaga sp.]
MKRLFFTLFAALALTGCAGVDLGALGDSAVRVTETLTDENTSTARGVTAGMSSTDAATVLMNRDYYNAVKAIAGVGTGNGQARTLVEIEANDGRPITIDAKSFKVYAPPAQVGGSGYSLAPPPKVESTGLKLFREVKDTLASVFIPWYSIQKTSEVQRLQITTSAEVQTFLARENSNLMRDLVGTQPDP